MNNKSIFRPMHLALTFFAAATLSVTSCKEKVEDTEEVAEEQNDEKLDGAQENAAEFLVEAAEMDLQEIQLGKLAQRSTNQDIKLHGRMMEEEHTKSSNDLKALAAQKGIALPPSLTEDGMEAYKTLNDKKLEDFDRAYIDMMVENHERAVTKFENNVQNTEDADVKAWASKTLETLRSHLEHTRALQEKIKNNK